MDFFGIQKKCCGCIPLRIAAIIICILTLIWGAMEIVAMKKFLQKFIEDDFILTLTSFIYIIFTIGLLLVAGLLLLGIILERHLFVNLYIWYTLAYLCFVLVFCIIGVTLIEVTGKKPTARHAFKLTLALLWYILMFYFLLVVNSYRAQLRL